MEQGNFLTIVPYRCVCGNALALTGNSARNCLQCGRRVPEEGYNQGDVTLIGGVEIDPDESNDRLVRKKLKHFRILAPLGRGGMGVVYRAVDESLESDVALKVIRSAGQSQSEHRLVKRLLEEARAQARVTHPNIVQVYYVDAQGEVPFLAMELVPGLTLEERLHEGPMDFSEIVDLAIQTTRALQAAAKFHIVHGDIKPANLLISKDGTIKLSDFGLARPVDHLSDELTGISGTPNYLSPEACRGDATHHQSDMYSLGVVLFQATFGCLPYPVNGAPILARLRAHLDSEVEYPQNWPTEIPVEWKKVLEVLLAKDPDDRYANYEEMLRELEKLRPVDLPIAGTLVRGVAWLIDLVVLLILMQAVENAGQQLLACPRQGVIAVVIALIAASILASATMLQVLTGQTPGKHLLQIRVVNHHGFAVPGATLVTRGCLQLLSLWGVVGLKLATAVGVSAFGWVIAVVCAAFSIIDAGFAMFRSDRRSLHDLMLNTNVVLDTTVQKWARLSGRRRPRTMQFAHQDDPTAFGVRQEYSTQSSSLSPTCRD